MGFDGEENINLDDFELPQQPGGNNSELVQTAFNSFKEYFNKNKGSTVVTETKPQQPQPQQQRRRKIVKNKLPQQPKVVELESDQIEKLLATGKLKSKKIGDSQVIEITQDQLNELYAMENGGEFKVLLGGEQQEVVQQPQQQQPEIVQQQEIVRQPPRQQVVQQQQPQTTPSVAPTTPSTPQTAAPTAPPATTPQKPTPPPIIYQFNTNDFETQQQNYQQQQQQNYQLTSSRPQQQQFPRQQIYTIPSPHQHQQIPSHIKTPTFEFISVPPVSYSTAVQQQEKRSQDPLPSSRGKVYFPNTQINGGGGARFNRGLTPEQLNTFYEDDGLNYKDNSDSNNGDKDVERLRGV